MEQPTKKEELQRLRQIVQVLLRYEGDFIVEQLQLHHLLPPGWKPRKTKGIYQPRQLRLLFEELGASFVKFGQLLSLRTDLLPRAYVEELSRLQDQVKPVAFKAVREVVEDELGAPLEKHFLEFEKTPLSSASVSQVHKARLPDGTQVAVKVQRPDIAKLFERDIAILRFLAGMAEKHMQQDLFSPLEFVREFESYTERELDFTKEARNLQRFHSLLEGDTIAMVPKVFWNVTTKKVITMEYVDGVPLHHPGQLEKQGLDPTALARNLANALYSQILVFGEFHADPHPGNILALPGDRIAFLDFGIVGRFSPAMQRHLRDAFLSIMEKDIDGLIQSLGDLHVLSQKSDLEQFRSDLVEELGQFYNVSLEKIKLSTFVHELLRVMRRNHIEVPRDLMLLGKALITLEGTCLTLDPGFNPVDSGRSFLRTLWRRERSPRHIVDRIVRETVRLKRFIFGLPDQTRDALDALRKADDALISVNDTVKVLTRELDRSSSRISMALVITGLLIASAVLTHVNILPYRGVSLLSLVGFGLSGILALQLILSTLSEHRLVSKYLRR